MENNAGHTSQEHLLERLLGVVLPLLLFGLCVVASFFPEKRLWGINHLAFYSPLVRVVAFLAVASFFVPRIRRTVYRRLNLYATPLLGRLQLVHVVILSILALGLFVIFPSSTLLLGDGQYIASNVEKAAGADSKTFVTYLKHPDRVYPATDLLYLIASRVASKLFDSSPLAGVRFLNALLGSALIFLLITALRRSVTGSAGEIAPLLALVFFSGGIQVFFGYIEVYAPLMLVVVLYTLAVRRTLSRRSTLWAPIFCVMFGVFLHLLGLILVPSLCFLALWVGFGRQMSKRMLKSCIVLTAATIAFPIVGMQTGALRSFFLPLINGGDTYGAFSRMHLIDIANELLLVFPGALVLAAIAISTVKVGKSRTPSDKNLRSMQTPVTHWHQGLTPDLFFGLFLLLPAVLFLLLFKPELGMARDWDLFVITGAGLYVSVFALLGHYQSDGIVRRMMESAVVPVLAITFVLTAAWVGINANSARSVARYESVLSYDTTNAGYAYENLAIYYQDRGDASAEIRALEKAVSASPNPRYGFLLGLRYYHAGQEAKAVSALRKCLRSNPDYDRARQFLVQMLFFREEFDEMLVVCQEGARLTPEEALYPFLAGKVYLTQGKVTEALVAFDKCRTLKLSAEMARELDELLRRLQHAE